MPRPRKQPLVYTKRAVAYCRISKKDDGVYGLDAQRSVIETWAAREGFQVALYGVDDGVTGDTPPDLRSGLVEALAALQPGDTFVVSKRDRLSRDLAISLTLERSIDRDYKCKLVSADGAGNGSSAEDELMRSMLGAIAQYEKRLISMRTKAALARAKAAGKRIGSPRVEHVRPWLVKRLVGMRLAGLSYPAICKQLHLAGVKPDRGHTWYPTTIKRILDRAVITNES